MRIHICGCSYLCVFLSYFASWESLSLNVELVDLTLSQIPDMDHHVWVLFTCMSEIQTWVHILWFTNWVPSRKAGMGKEVERMVHLPDGFIVCSCMFFCKVYVFGGMFTLTRPCFWGSLSLASDLPNKVDKLASRPQGSSCYCPLSGNSSLYQHAWLFIWVLRIKLISPADSSPQSPVTTVT